MRNKLILSLILFCSIGLTACGQAGPQGLIGPIGPQGPTGETGETGQPGKDGVGIISVNKTGTKDKVDTYTITYSDGTSSIFVIVNGENGEQGIQGVPGKDGQTPVISISDDGYWMIDGIKTQTKAQGEKGDAGSDGQDGAPGVDGQDGKPGQDGQNGLSAYEIYKKYHPEYTGTEEEWINEISGNIKSECIIKFNANNGTTLSNLKLKTGNKISKPEKPVMDNFTFAGWEYNNEFWNFNSGIVTEDMTLNAVWYQSDCKFTILEGMDIRFDKCNVYRIPNNITEINLSDFFIGFNIVEIGSELLDPCMGNVKKIIVPDGTKRINYKAFYQKRLTEIVLPDSVDFIAPYAFGQNELKAIKIPANIKTLNELIFDYNDFVTELVIPRNVTKINALGSMRGLKKVYIPKEVVEVSDYFVYQGRSPLTVYCEASSKPAGWSNKWDGNEPNVVWGATMPY